MIKFKSLNQSKQFLKIFLRTIFQTKFDIQKKRIYNALLNSSSKEVINFNNVLNKIINEKI